MKLIRFGSPGAEKPGIFKSGDRLDCSKYFTDWNRSFFRDQGLEELKRILASNQNALPQVDASERWGSPIARPGMILCIGLNYSDHALESQMEIPKEPIIFMKATNTLAGPYDTVTIPKESSKTDWEIELG
ncbi:MAG: fumarylacetoacetate hydrolase family protein, partial [Bacteroidota bacterium]